jgi:biotin synthase-like enzyme
MNIERITDDGKMSIGETAADIRHHKKTVALARIKRGDGHKIWQLDLKTGVITQAEITWSATISGGKHGKVNRQPDCLYCSALNHKNAYKAFRRMVDKIVEMEAKRIIESNPKEVS